jgi:hypothetical protein
MMKPRVTGQVDPKNVGMCTYRWPETQTACVEPARWHGVQGERRYGIMTCDEHRHLMLPLVHWVHEAGTACGLPTARFDHDANVCYLDWETFETELLNYAQEGLP